MVDIDGDKTVSGQKIIWSSEKINPTIPKRVYFMGINISILKLNEVPKESEIFQQNKIVDADPKTHIKFPKIAPMNCE